ncbi:sigma-54-dependent transcriptional regulator [Candidatus Zixiibacteriota bacterium]
MKRYSLGASVPREGIGMKQSPRIAVVEDDPVLLDILAGTLTDRGFDVAVFNDGESFLNALEAGETPDVAVLDIRLPGADGITLLKHLREDIPACRVVMMTAFSSIDTMLDSLRQGAVEFLLKPVSAAEVADAVEQSLWKRRSGDSVSEAVAEFDVCTTDLQQIMGASEAVRDMEAFVQKAGQVDVPVLVTGETGTGKEVVARAIHEAGSRSSRTMITLNCGAIPEPLIESELFGHVRGTFTGAISDRHGLFEEADGSTLFLDEIGDLPLASQVKLLRVLQEGLVRRLGGRSDQKVDVRIIAATNRDLESEVSAGTFRKDLFYRLSVLRLRVPTLRERREDIPHLISRFISTYSHREELVLSKRALKALSAYPWPGNVRELENEVARAVTLTEGERIEYSDLSEEMRSPAQLRGTGSLKAALETKERQIIVASLQRTEWNKTETARILGMSRQNLYQRMEHHGIPLTPMTSEGGGDKKR